MASTPSTDSDAAPVPRYGFAFSWTGPYGHSIRLLERIGSKRGLVIDLGCGFAAVAEPLVERGYGYVGTDIDAEALTRVSMRGLEAHQLDLTATDALADRIYEIASDRSVAAVFALDVIEHIPRTRSFLRTLAAALDRLGRPPLIVSVPNIAHVDVAAKLMFGRWDYTRTGLLDGTHVSFFTHERLRAETRACGFVELDSLDHHQSVSDQRFPADHPALADGSPVAQLARIWREAADEHWSTIQFVRAFYLTDLDSSEDVVERPSSAIPAPARTLTVVVRTQGRRPTSLRDALTCLAAQTVDAFDVHLMVHTDDTTAVASVTEIVDEFDPTFARRVSVLQVGLGGGRARPLNVALEGLESEYVAFLDDDDLVTANWAECFCKAAGDSSVVRSLSARRYVAPPTDPASVPYVVRSGLEFPFSPTFDLAEHLWQNQTPICAYAVPRALIEMFSLRFDEQFPVLEDWAFLLRCVAFASVRDTGEVTSIAHVWLDGESSRSLHSEQLWISVERVLREQLNTQPLLLPAGSVATLVDLRQRHAELEAQYRLAETERLRSREEIERLRSESLRLGDELADLTRQYLVTITSKRWRVLGPVARMIQVARRLRGLRYRG